MKASVFKKILKEAVREVFQEELKELLLEAIKSSKPILQESYTPAPPVRNQSSSEGSINFKKNIREEYAQLMDTINNPTPQNHIPSNESGYNPIGAHHGTVVNGALPDGEVSMGQIMGLTGR